MISLEKRAKGEGNHFSIWVMNPRAINGRMNFSRLLAASQSFSEALCQLGCFCIKMGDYEHVHAVSY